MTSTPRSLATLECIGGHPAFDLANTINSRRAPQHDYLPSYADLLVWVQCIGLVEAEHARQLARRAEVEPARAAAVLERTLWLRELIYGVFGALASGSLAPDGDLALLQAEYGTAAGYATPVWASTHYRLSWTDGALEDAYWPLAFAAGELLQRPVLPRVRACPRCGWLFLDTSKGGQRRWCSMAMCGAQDKMRRYRARARTAADTE